MKTAVKTAVKPAITGKLPHPQPRVATPPTNPTPTIEPEKPPTRRNTLNGLTLIIALGASILISGHTGIKIPVEGDLEQIQTEIANSIRQLILQPQRLTQMSNNAAAFAQEFSWERRMETILQDIKPLLRYEDAHLRLERI